MPVIFTYSINYKFGFDADIYVEESEKKVKYRLNIQFFGLY